MARIDCLFCRRNFTLIFKCFNIRLFRRSQVCSTLGDVPQSWTFLLNFQWNFIHAGNIYMPIQRPFKFGAFYLLEIQKARKIHHEPKLSRCISSPSIFSQSIIMMTTYGWLFTVFIFLNNELSQSRSGNNLCTKDVAVQGANCRFLIFPNSKLSTYFDTNPKHLSSPEAD